MIKFPKKGALDKLGFPITRERYRQMKAKSKRQWQKIEKLEKELAKAKASQKSRYLLYNLKSLKDKRMGVVCLDCGWIRVSWDRHDYGRCPCPNQTSIDE